MNDSAIRARVDSATREFQSQWRYAWQETQRAAPSMKGVYVKDAAMRSLALHCHWIQGSLRIREHVIKSTERTHAMCPIWYQLDGPKINDERQGIDFGLSREGRQTIRPLRQELRMLLESAAQQLPDDMYLTGQRIRLALDAGDFSHAKSIAATCARDAVQCGLLRGLVLYSIGDIVGAEAAFVTAAHMMGDNERCAWNHVGVLLEPEARREYTAMTCAARAELETRLWWLADPLYLEQGNERLAEHYARKVLITLLAPLGFDGRQHWQSKQGGDAVAEAHVRYGWPTQMFWGGHAEDTSHDKWLEKFDLDTAPPYVAMEYSRDRLHTVPHFSVLRTPFEALPDDWQLNAPKGDDEWWPAEHFARDRSAIVQLPLGQQVMLRRHASTRFVWAGDLDATDLGRPRGDSVGATLFQSRAVSDVVVVHAFSGRVGTPMVVDALLRPGPALIGIELPGDRTHAAARTRFGVDVPPVLASLAGDKALSQPMLFEPPVDDRASLDADAAIKRIFGTTALKKPRRVGVYWEAYGFSATDTVEIEVMMSREDRSGVLHRVAGVFRLGPEKGSSLGIRWRETSNNSRAIQRREGDVAVQMRSVILDVSSLARGTYRMMISMSSGGGSVSSSERPLVIL